MRSENPLRRLTEMGQSPWCDQLSRQMLVSGELAELVTERGIVGLTSNPTIFRQALAAGDWYDEQIRAESERGLEGKALYEALAVRDIQVVADLLLPVYEDTNGADGFVSLEVSPDLAHDAEGSVAEARRLWSAVDQPNLMVKIPGTRAGLLAVAQLLGEGINVNVTLIFGLSRYREVLAAHAEGLARAAANGLAPERIASVASFFVSRVDTAVDRMLEEGAKCGGDAEALYLRALQGRAAIANARVARTIWESWRDAEPMRSLRARGARPQRLLWASTSTKNPAYRDVRYVEELIGSDTVNTMPLETILAFTDHGRVRGATLVDHPEEALATLEALASVDIDMEAIARDLEAAGVSLFKQSFDELLAGLVRKSERAGVP
jgi:transaldolase